MRKRKRLLLILIFLGIFLFSGYQLLGLLGDYQDGQDSYQSLNQYVSLEATQPTAATVLPDSTEPSQTMPTLPPDVSDWPVVDFEALRQINPDVVGWILIEGTNINYPIVQGADNDYYLNHLFDGRYNKAGCIFLDYRCAADLSDPHSILYGHHMRDFTMFTHLMNYKDPAFYDTHPTALIVSENAYYRIQFFSGYVTNNEDNAWEIDPDQGDFSGWLTDIQNKSSFKPQILPPEDARILTLSTCTYEFNSAKFVLHGFISETIEKP